MDIKEIEVVGHRVLIEPYLPKETTEWGFKIDVGDSFKREQASTQEGTIIGVGPNAWLAFDDGKPWAKIGDRVIYAKYAGKFIKVEDKTYVIVNDEDVQCVLHGNVEESEINVG